MQRKWIDKQSVLVTTNFHMLHLKIILYLKNKNVHYKCILELLVYSFTGMLCLRLCKVKDFLQDWYDLACHFEIQTFLQL